MPIAIALLVISTTPAVSERCPAPAGWATPERHVAAAMPAMRFALPTGTTRLRLRPAAAVKLAAPSAHRAMPKHFAGLAAVDVARAGTLEVVLSNASYVDLIRGNAVLPTQRFGETRQCPGMRKSVSFVVKPGRYIVQLTDAPTATVKLGLILR